MTAPVVDMVAKAAERARAALGRGAEGVRPLAYRLPVPPAVFCGREDSAARLRGLIARGAVTVVVGPGGIGKSALASQVLHGLMDAAPAAAAATGAPAWSIDPATTVAIGLRPGDGIDQLWIEVARALAGVSGLEVQWDGTLARPQMLAAWALDLAERRRATIVVDDLHHLPVVAGDADTTSAPSPTDHDDARTWLEVVARHAHKSRWLALTRRAPGLPLLAEQTLHLGALAPDALLALATACTPDAAPDLLAAAVRAAEGSPYRLRQAMVAAPALPPALGVLEGPLGPALLARALGLDAAEAEAVIARLAGAAQLVAVPGGIQLHDEARAALSLGPNDAARAAALALLTEANLAGAEADEAPEATLERLRLALAEGRQAEALALLDRHLDALVADGLGLRLWQLFAAGPSLPLSALVGHRLKLAATLGRSDMLDWAGGLAPPSDPAVWLAWLDCHYLAGRYAAVLSARMPDALGPDPAAPSAVAFDAQLAKAKAAIATGQLRDALALLSAARPRDPAEPPDLTNPATARHAMLMAQCEVLGGHTQEGQARARRVLDDAPALPPRVQSEVYLLATAVFMNAGNLKAALDAETALTRAIGPPSLVGARGADRALRRLTLEVETGSVDAARASLRQLHPALPRLHRLIAGITSARLHCALGELAGVAADVEGLVIEARENGLAEFHGWLLAMRALAATVVGTRQLTREAPALPAAHPARAYAALYTWIHARRMADASLVGAPPEPFPDVVVPADAPVDVRCILALARAEAAFHEGAATDSAMHARAALQLAEEAGFAIFALDALLVLCDALLIARELPGLRTALDALTRAAARLPSPRFLAHAAFFELAFACPSVPALEARLAAPNLAPDVAPDVRRRLGRLLDARAPADGRDQRVVAALVAVQPAAVITTSTRGAEPQLGPSWGYDVLHQLAWTPTGQTIDLARYPLLGRLLEALAADGGTASLEALAARVWGIDAYHPIRDAKRIHVAVRRLRELIEADPSHPSCIVTVADGQAANAAYAVGRGAPFRLHARPVYLAGH